MEQFALSERRACRLVALDRSSYRYEPRADHNAGLREELVKLARQKPRYGYRRLHVLLGKRGHAASAQRIYRLYREERLMVRRLRRKPGAPPFAVFEGWVRAAATPLRQAFD
jgi:putative transposase